MTGGGGGGGVVVVGILAVGISHGCVRAVESVWKVVFGCGYGIMKGVEYGEIDMMRIW